MNSQELNNIDKFEYQPNQKYEQNTSEMLFEHTKQLLRMLNIKKSEMVASDLLHQKKTIAEQVTQIRPKKSLPLQVSTIREEDQQNQNQQQIQSIENLLKARRAIAFNEQRLAQIELNLRQLFSVFVQKYNSFQAQMMARVDEKCLVFTDILNRTLKIIEKSTQYGQKIQEKVSIFQKSLRDTCQSLRVCKLKQQCLQAVIQHKTINQRNNSNNKLKSTNQDKLQELHQRVSSLTAKYVSADPSNSKLNDSLSQNSQSKLMINSECKLSPFDVSIGQYSNRISNLTILNEDSNIDFSSLLNKKSYPKSGFQISQFIEFLKTSQTNELPIKCYLDQLGYLRRTNGTYMFDKKGNLAKVNLKEYQRLLEQNIIYRSYN